VSRDIKHEYGIEASVNKASSNSMEFSGEAHQYKDKPKLKIYKGKKRSRVRAAVDQPDSKFVTAQFGKNTIGSDNATTQVTKVLESKK
jgi:hypothetical protein